MSRHNNLALAAGWLLADVFLVLAIVAWSSNDRSLSIADATAPTTTTVADEPVNERDRGIEVEARIVEFALPYPQFLSATPDQLDYLRDVIRQRFQRQRAHRWEAGFVLTFGFHPTPGVGQEIAARFNELIRETMPIVFGHTALRNFDYRSSDGLGKVRLEIYYFTRG